MGEAFEDYVEDTSKSQLDSPGIGPIAAFLTWPQYGRHDSDAFCRPLGNALEGLSERARLPRGRGRIAD